MIERDRKFLDHMLSTGRVMRYHTNPAMGRQQTVAEHVYRVTHVLGFLYGDDPVPHSMLLAAMYHDFEEVITGDLPSYFRHGSGLVDEVCTKVERDLQRKHLLPDKIKPLSTTEQHIFNTADVLERGLHALALIPSTPRYMLVLGEALRWLDNNEEGLPDSFEKRAFNIYQELRSYHTSTRGR